MPNLINYKSDWKFIHAATNYGRTSPSSTSLYSSASTLSLAAGFFCAMAPVAASGIASSPASWSIAANASSSPRSSSSSRTSPNSSYSCSCYATWSWWASSISSRSSIGTYARSSLRTWSPCFIASYTLTSAYADSIACEVCYKTNSAPSTFSNSLSNNFLSLS